MSELWSDRAKWQRVLSVELAAADVLAEDGIIPTDAAAKMRKLAAFDTDKIDEYEAVVRHDLIAFLQSVGDSLGNLKRFLHLGLTSYDVIDTALSVALTEAGKMILNELKRLRKALGKQALIHKNTVMAGRTHGVHAEPTTFGWKICGWIAEADRDVVRLEAAIESVNVGKISGAVGTFPVITAEQEVRICKKLGLGVDPVSTQVIARDRHAEFLCTLAIVAGLVERIALEVRLLQHSEVEELSEPFNTGQRGSSAMPHKKNPVATENLSGLARLVRSTVSAGLENIPLWHERDISHSSVERVIFPDATSLVYYMLERCCWVVDNWVVDTARMKQHLDADRGLMSSGQVLTALKLAGIDDDNIYKRVQNLALSSRSGGLSFPERVRADTAIVKCLGKKLEDLFDDSAVLQRVNIPFSRTGLK